MNGVCETPVWIAIDCSAARTCVAVRDALGREWEREGGNAAFGVGELLDSLLLDAGCAIERISRVGVSEGPGSFTGLRIAFGFARGLGAAVGCRLVKVPTFWALAHGYAGSGETIAVTRDAGRGEYFFGLYAAPAGELREISSVKIVNTAELQSALAENSIQPGLVVNDDPDQTGIMQAVEGAAPHTDVARRWKVVGSKSVGRGLIAAMTCDALAADGDFSPRYIRAVAAKTIQERALGKAPA